MPPDTPRLVPLWKATAYYITKELMLLFNWVGILKDILTDQVMPFT